MKARPEPASTPKPKPKATPGVTRAKRVAPPAAVARPRDGVRLGLPSGALAHRSSRDRDMSGALLVAAAFLLGAAAAGSLLLGVAARSAARHA